MNQIKIIFGLMVLAILSSCEKEQTLAVSETQANPSIEEEGNNTELTFRGGGECDEYTRFRDEFCVYKTPETPTNPPELVLTAPPDNPELFVNRKVELHADGKTIYATPLRNLENDIDFLLEMDGREYILTKSSDTVINSKAEEGDVPGYLNALFLAKDGLLAAELSAYEIGSALNGSASVTTGQDATIIDVTSPELLPGTGKDGMLLVRGCDWEKAVTINKYLSRIGWPNDDLTLYPFFVETAMDDCGWKCRECIDPVCVFEKIEFFLGSQDDLDMLHQAFIKYSLDLTEEEAERLGEPENSQISGLLLTFMQGGDFCRQFEVGAEIVDLLEEGIMQDACNSSTTQQDMLLSVMTENGFGGFGYDDFYVSLGENTDFVIRRHFEHCPKMDCVLDKVLETGLCNEIVMQFEELEGEFDLIFQYDYNCMSPPFSYTLHYVNGCDFSGSQNDYATTLARPNCYKDAGGNDVCNPFSIQLYNKHFCNNLSPLEMAAIFIHETIHSEFHRWVYEGTTGTTLNIEDFRYDSEVWNQVVLEKYGSNAITNHHALMNEYLVPALAEDLWALNGETDPSKTDSYKYFVYDLLAPDAQLVSLGFLSQTELDQLKDLSSQISSNLGCE